MPSKKGLKPSVTPLNEPEPGIESSPTPHDPAPIESGGKSPSKTKTLKTSKDEIPLGEKDLSTPSLGKNKKFGFRKKIRVAPSKEGIVKSEGTKSGSGVAIKGAESTKTLEDLQVAPHLFKLGIRSEDEENQKVWSLRAALRDKKTLLILGLVVSLLLITLVAIILIFASPSGTEDPTSTTVTMMMTTRFFNRGCGLRPKPENSTRLGKWCACFWREDKDPVKECFNCCKRRNATDVPLCRNECPPPQGG